MNTAVTLTFTESDEDFFGAEVAQPKATRHWLLDHRIGRDLLKIKLASMENAPSGVVPWRRGEEFDGMLNAVVDILGLRDLPAPETVWEDAKVSVSLAGKMFAVAAGRI